MFDVEGKEINEGDKIFTIQGWTGIAKKDDTRLYADFKKWCGAFVRKIDITEDTIKRYDMKKVK